MTSKPSKTGRRTTSTSRAKTASSAVSPMIKDVEQLVQLMIDNDLSEVDIQDGPQKIMLKRGSTAPTQVVAEVAPVPAAPAGGTLPLAEEAAPDLAEITSPMVGTFYGASSPDVDDFVSVGDVVGPEDSVCIVEAMKVMNEIKAECSGKIVEICVKSGQPVEFGQPLFKISGA